MKTIISMASELRAFGVQYFDYVIFIVALFWFLLGVLLGRYVRIGRTGNRKKVSPAEQGERRQRGRGRLGDAELYVGNLPYEINDARLQKMFAEYGKVVSARIITNKTTGSSKGYGFVEMGDVDSALEATKGLNSETVDGRRIVVSGAKTDARRGRGFRRRD